jgi:hypothetical protein
VSIITYKYNKKEVPAPPELLLCHIYLNLLCSRLDALHVGEHEYTGNDADSEEDYPDCPERNPHPEETRN